MKPQERLFLVEHRVERARYFTTLGHSPGDLDITLI